MKKAGRASGIPGFPGFLSVLGHVVAAGPGDFPGRGGVLGLQLALLLLPLLGRILFVPLLVEVAQEDVRLLCHDNWEEFQGKSGKNIPG